MAMVQSLDRYWTAAEVRALPDDGARHECIDGMLILRSPTDELWIVDIESRVVERWRAGDERPEILTDGFVWHPKGAAQPLSIALGELFASVHGETR